METIKKRIPCIMPDSNGIPVLYVQDEPFLILGGELHNSSSSSLEFMEKEVWPYIRQFKMNTVILPVAWESIESQEGCFDFTLLDGILLQARREEVRVVLLWFGLWKNGESFYVPSWVKEDDRRFFRACYGTGRPSNTVSPFCREAVEADKKAFCRLMKFLREKDEKEQTVIMVQVENEIGFLKAERDYSETAQEEYKKTVPEEIRELYGKDGSWEQALGEDAPEYFMAYHYAKDVEEIASAGKKIYPLPMYVNAWLEQHPDRPGCYPSGGPVGKLISLWKKAAPSLDLIAPDIYLPDLKGVCEEYSVCGNTLFIPEARRDPVTASNAFYALGGMNAIGFSPFAVEDFLKEEMEGPEASLLAALNIEVDGFSCRGTGPYLVKSYQVLNELYPLLLKRRGTDRMIGFIRRNPYEKGTIISLDGYDLQLDYLPGKTGQPGSAGIIFIEENGFYISGCQVRFTPLPKKGSNTYITIVSLEEGKFKEGKWERGRVLNGDELNDMTLKDMAETKYVRVCVHKS